MDPPLGMSMLTDSIIFFKASLSIFVRFRKFFTFCAKVWFLSVNGNGHKNINGSDNDNINEKAMAISIAMAMAMAIAIAMEMEMVR